MNTYFHNLGDCIERDWLKHSYDEEIFPQLAVRALEREALTKQVEVSDIVDRLFDPVQILCQPNDYKFFGEPPITLFQAPRFYIEALFWFSGTTAIHEHAFSGAFIVLAGSSVHSHWSFKHERTVSSRMLCGRLERLSTEILRSGDIRPVHSGDRLIHQLFHLDLPSVTVVIRTYQQRHHLPQYQYLLPGLAIDHEDLNGLRARRLMLLDSMARGQITGLRNCSEKLVNAGDLETLYYMFSGLTRRKLRDDIIEELYKLSHERYGDIVNLFRKVCEGERRTRIITALRSKVTAPGPRFLLALLMLMPDRDAILETIRLQFPDAEPIPLIETWLGTISGREIIGFDFNHVNRLIFRSLVEGLDTEGLLQRLQGEFRDGSIETHRDRLLDQAKQLAKSELFRPLLSESPLQEPH
jgi:hypothetical protein